MFTLSPKGDGTLYRIYTSMFRVRGWPKITSWLSQLRVAFGQSRPLANTI